jgi:ribonuclease HI
MIKTILVDSSTKPISPEIKPGESVAAWAMWNSETMNDSPILCGISYFKQNGPNKTFYEGIIRALEQCMEYCWNDEVIIKGDCQPVIKQLNKEWKVVALDMQYRQVQGLVSKYEKKQNQVKFQYIGENDPVYSKVDQLAKKGRDFIHKNLCR